MRRAKSLAWIGGVGLLGLTPAIGFAQGLPLPPAPEGVTQTQTMPVAPGAAASQDVQQTGGSDQRIAKPRDLVLTLAVILDAHGQKVSRAVVSLIPRLHDVLRRGAWRDAYLRRRRAF